MPFTPPAHANRPSSQICCCHASAVRSDVDHLPLRVFADIMQGTGWMPWGQGTLPVMTYRLLSTIYRGGRDVARLHCFNAQCNEEASGHTTTALLWRRQSYTTNKRPQTPTRTVQPLPRGLKPSRLRDSLSASSMAQQGSMSHLAWDTMTTLLSSTVRCLVVQGIFIDGPVVPHDRKHSALTPLSFSLTPKPKTKACPP